MGDGTLNTSENNYSYFKRWWQNAPPATKKGWRTALLFSLLLWLLGAVFSYYQVAAIRAVETPVVRAIYSGLMGPMGLWWGFLKFTGFIQETSHDPSGAWRYLIALRLVVWGAIGFIFNATPHPEVVQKREAALQRKAQGQLDDDEVAEKLAIENGVPLATVKVTGRKKKPVTVGLNPMVGQGHVLVSGPTRSGKGLHLTEALLHWPGTAVIVDPKGEQYKRTAGFREKYLGPVYHIPGHEVELSSLYNLQDSDDIKELHDQLLQPEQDTQRIFADKSLSLFEAVGHYAKARRIDPIRVLLDAASDDFTLALRAMDSVPAARREVRKFTNNLPPELFNQDRFVASAYGTFTTRLYNYQKHIDTIAPRTILNSIPLYWERENATIYITYNLTELQGVGGVVAAILAGLMRYHMNHTDPKHRLLVAVDELAAVRLRNLETYLATVGGYGITMLLYAQALAQLEGIYGRTGTEAILSNTAHQVWYPPNDMETARRISALYGTTRRANRSFNSARRYAIGGSQNGQANGYQDYSVGQTMHEEPLLKPTEVMSLPKDQVIVITEKDRQYRFIGQRLNPLDKLENLPAAPKPLKLEPPARVYTKWMERRSAPLPTERDKTTPSDIPESSQGGNEGGSGNDLPDSANNSASPKKPLK